MNRDDKHDPLLEDDDGESHAADEPTAVWDESALRAAGLTELLNRRKSDPPPPPATKSSVPDRPSIEVSQEMAVAVPEPVRAEEPAPPLVHEPAVERPASSGMGWGATLVLAVLLGAVVYALIRFAKG